MRDLAVAVRDKLLVLELDSDLEQIGVAVARANVVKVGLGREQQLARALLIRHLVEHRDGRRLEPLLEPHKLVRLVGDF